MVECLSKGKQICFCGRKHSTNIEELCIQKGCLEQLHLYVKKRKIKKILLLCRAEDAEKGHAVQKLLKNTGAVLQKLYIDTDEITSEIQYAGLMMMRTDMQTDLAVIVGSGEWINTSRYLCDRLGIPAALVLTGITEINFCASWIAVREEGIPHFHKIAEPAAVYADPQIASTINEEEAISAGLAFYGTWIALYEWRLSHLITEEYYCPYLEQEFLRMSETAAVQPFSDFITVMEMQASVSLLITYADDPALISGSYHLLKEFWSRKIPAFCWDERSKKESGIRCLALDAAYCLASRIGNMVGDRWKVFEEMNPEYRENKIRSLYGNQADFVLNLEKKTGKNSREKVFVRRRKTESCYREIQKIDYLLPAGDEIRAVKKQCFSLKRDGMLSEEEFYEGLLFAGDMVNRYNVLQFLYDMGRLDQAAVQMKTLCRKYQ
ncbi:MAG: iron-containing alcohol dehydrogenase [Lachnospiraceae bacterium]|nr:iron-containing alcohol dehydrogenase [Lachnospiraceae bacterium]MDY4971808.1 iron-containing alcohol dehydrogenase [Lachnospiraceae bacterium]